MQAAQQAIAAALQMLQAHGGHSGWQHACVRPEPAAAVKHMQGLCGHIITLAPATAAVQPARLVAAHWHTSLGQAFTSTTSPECAWCTDACRRACVTGEGLQHSLLLPCGRAWGLPQSSGEPS